ncbi:MAG: hypothetical protein K8I29_19745 [Alphaproteobacteria bacterium]|uniref:Uncharacterized protein n=1 Tax=Candidatus Nitrobium versatile TaxID=2884831 RepID=A0A953M3X1_9BACT|nr:hypothetical protein [Candidatus Nitrobium versatile]
MNTLIRDDLHFVVSRLPKDIRNVMQKHRIFLAGGFIRATIAGEKPSDIDLFGGLKESLRIIALELSNSRKGKLHETQNAYTVLAPPRIPVQFITRWLYLSPELLVESFDFTIAQACIWFDGEKWHSMCSDRFYPDLAARRLYYTAPERHEDAGDSMLRLRKFLSKGYTIQASSMAAVIARLVRGVDFEHLREIAGKEAALGKALTNLLREVDPLTVIDGIEIVDEHEVEPARANHEEGA